MRRNRIRLKLATPDAGPAPIVKRSDSNVAFPMFIPSRKPIQQGPTPTNKTGPASYMGEAPIQSEESDVVRPDESSAEMTGTQRTSVLSFGGGLAPSMPVRYSTYRDIRKDPTIGMARQLVAASIVSGAWSTEVDDDVPDDIIKSVEEIIMPLRDDYMLSALFGTMDFGWQSFEKVFTYDEERDLIVVKKLKPLLQDITIILVETYTGAYAGLRQIRPVDVTLMPDKAVLVNINVEGTNWYGEGFMERARSVYNEWKDCNEGARRYDRKIAGSHWVIWYPVGKSDFGGTMTDNAVIAATILNTLESSGGISVPNVLHQFLEDNVAKPENYGWRIELKESSPSVAAGFKERLTYLDTMKVRAFSMPERSLLETQFGTKADSKTHKDLAVTNLEMYDRLLTKAFCLQVLDQFVELNWSKQYRGKVRLVASPIDDETSSYVEEIFKMILANPQGFAEEFAQIDTDAIKDKLGIPKSGQVAQAGDKHGGNGDVTMLPPEPPLEGVPTEKLKQIQASLRNRHFLNSATGRLVLALADRHRRK